MRKLQPFNFEKSHYERPNQKWICGRAQDGQCCLAGPDERGNCMATAECRPLRKGDRWHCTRPAFLGGPCPEGPSPDGQCCRQIPKCSPIRSSRSWRGIVVMLAMAATLAGLLVVFASKQGNTTISPGPLSFAHRSVGDNCSECHEQMDDRPARWIVSSGVSHSAHDNSGQCLKCHNMGEAPLQPHSLIAARLQPLTEIALKTSHDGNPPASLKLASLFSSPAHSGGDALACATCHKEHQGREADLKKLTNNECQNCHAGQFASFASGHPNFTHYPFERRTRIIFDHEAHIRQHFRDAAVAKLAPSTCLDCHETDLRGGTMLVKSFEVVCASCHDNEIKAKSAVKTGVPFMGLPRMDDRALTGNYSIGEWPEDADQPVTPFLRLLLSGDPDLREAMDTLKGVDFSSLPKSDPEKLKAAQKVAWGIKGFIFDVNTHGQDELIQRLNASLGRALTDYEKEGVVAFMNADAVRTTFKDAFPNLQKEVLDYRNKGKTAATKLVPSPELAGPGPVKNATPDAWVSQGGWYSPDGSFTLYYHPRGHQDRFLSTWMDLTVDAGQASDPAGVQALFKDLSAPKAVGLCSKCHSIDDTPAKVVNWTSSRPDPAEHGFNRFSHSKHLSLLDARGCFTCHSMKVTDPNSKDTYATAFEPGKRNPLTFSSNFKTIDKAACANCHQPNLVRDDCLLCHNYHIGLFKPVIPHSNIASVIPSSTKAP